jgi:diguanylate cyclase (GGDEF)-like protein/PAS domain S-box-containing protein
MDRPAEPSRSSSDADCIAASGPARDVFTLLKVIESAGLGTWAWHLPTGEVRFNERYAAILGHRLKELQPLTYATWAARVHPEDLPAAEAALAACREGRSERFEARYRMRHASGSWLWVHDRGLVASHTDEGGPAWLVGSHADITEACLQAQRLRTNERFLERTGRLARVGGWACDVRTGELRLSAEAQRLLGVAADAGLTLEQALALFTPGSRAGLRAAIADAVRSGVSWDFEAQLLPRAGAATWLRVNGAPEAFEGERRLLIGAVQDITDRVLERESLREAQERLRIATESGGIGIWSWDIQTGVLEWNEVNRAIFDSGKEGPLHYDDWESRLHPEDRAAAVAAVEAALRGDAPFSTEFRIVRADGEVRHVRGTGVVRRDAYGRPTSMVGANWDVTPLREMAARLAAQHELMRVTLESIGDAIVTTCARGTVAWLNHEAAAMLGCREEVARGRDVHGLVRLVAGEERQSLAPAIATRLAQGLPFDLPEDALLLANGAALDVGGSIAPIISADGEYLGMVISLHDMTPERAVARELRHRATHDVLTGLVNRSAFAERLAVLLDRAREKGELHCLLYLDLDEFKQVNDRFGHDVGDRLLQQLATLLGSGLRGSDTFARLGGDEFALLLEDCGIERAAEIAGELCARVAAFRIPHGEESVSVGVSIGLVPIDTRWGDQRALLRAADSACYAAKAAGRNGYRIWPEGGPEAPSGAAVEQRFAPRIERALAEGRFLLLAQRVVPADPSVRDDPRLLEVRLRLRDADGQLLGPAQFPPALGATLFASVDRHLLARTVAQLAVAPAGADGWCAQVGLGQQSLTMPSFRDWLLDWAGGLDPSLRARLLIGLPARVLAEGDGALRELPGALRRLGLGTVGWDYGAERPALPALADLALDGLRLDGRLIERLTEDRLVRLTLRAVCEAAGMLGLTTIAPRVERAEQLACLRELGVDRVQGPLLARPEPLCGSDVSAGAAAGGGWPG